MDKVSKEWQLRRLEYIKSLKELSQSDIDAIIMDALVIEWRDNLAWEMVCKLLGHILAVDSTVSTNNAELMVRKRAQP